MKKPKKPYEPQKPVAPRKTIKRPHRIYLGDFLDKTRYGIKSCNLQFFLDELSKRLPKDVSGRHMLNFDDVRICEETVDYDDSYFFAEYDVEEDNPHYDKEVLRFKKKEKEYAKHMTKYLPLQEAYLKEKVAYNEWYKADAKQKEIERKIAQIASLKNSLAKLERNK